MHIDNGQKTSETTIKPEKESPKVERDALPTLEKGLCVWWTNQSDAEATRLLLSAKMVSLPKYIEEEFISREGRDGRGRLWVAKGIELEGGIPWDNSKPAAIIINHGSHAGIVVRKEDFPLVKGLPGLVTDVKLDTV